MVRLENVAEIPFARLFAIRYFFGKCLTPDRNHDNNNKVLSRCEH